MTSRENIQSGQIAYLYSVISGGGGGSSNLADVLTNGNSAGASDIDMNNNDILLVNTITATTFVGALTGNSTSATEVGITSDNTSGTYYIPFAKTSGTGNQPLFIDDTTTPLTYNPNTSNLITQTINAIPIGQGVGSISSNTRVGIGALDSGSLTGISNTAFGGSALLSNTTGNSNSAIGFNTLKDNTTGSFNSAFGQSALQRNTTGSSNVGVGVQALNTNTIGGGNSAVGFNSLFNNTTGNFNTAFGNSALLTNTTGGNNVGVGLQALQANTTGSNNSAVGSNSLLNNTTGNFNSAFGGSALQANTTGSSNVGVGLQALISNTIGNSNSAIGFNSLQNNTTGENNTCIGNEAGTSTSPSGNITTANNRVCIGNNAVTNAFVKVAWTVTSDLRDKTNLKPIIHGLDFVNQLKPTEFQFREERGSEEIQEGGRIHYGFIAQDILALEGDRPVIIDNNDDECLKYTESHLIPVLVNAIKELTARVQALEAGK